MSDEEKLDLIAGGVYIGNRWSKQNTIAELEKLKAEFEEDKYILLNQITAIKVIDMHIAELKGNKNESE